MECLEAQVVLFVDHDADAAREVDSCASPYRLIVQSSQLLAHQMALVQQQPVLGGKLVDPNEHSVFDRSQAGESFANLRKDSKPLTVARSRSEGIALQVAGQPDPRGDHDVGVLAGGIEPAGTTIRKQRKIEHHSIPRSLSRMSAASSNCSASIARFSRSRSSVALETCGSSDGNGATYR